MLNDFIFDIVKKQDEFEQLSLYIEEAIPIIPDKKEDKTEVEERGVIIIEMF